MKYFLNKFGRSLAILQRKRRLKNHSFSIISNTCTGGVIAHNVGEQFRSPTVNLVIYEDQFLTFCEHLKEYSECSLEKPADEEMEKFKHVNYPVGVLRGSDKGLSDINLFFVHYKSFEEAQAKWYLRFKRINYDDVFVIMDRGLDASEEILDRFYKLPYKHKVFFTDRRDKQRWPDNFVFSFYTPRHYKSGCLYNNVWKGIYVHHWMDEFDYVTWLNDGTVKKSNFTVFQ